MYDIITKKYKEYGIEANQRTLPGIDGLKPVERRILYSAYQICRTKTIKSARLTGYVMGHYHPHSESYQTIVQLVQRGYLDGQGNWGSIYGIEPLQAAAQRYTEVKLNQWTENLSLKLINYVPYHSPEQLDDEPKYLPTMLPFCLFGNKITTGIGFGYRTYIPIYKPKDLYERLKYLLGLRKRKITIKPNLNCDILSPNSECEKLLTTGSARLDIKGKFEVDQDNFKVIVKSWSPNKRFESILNKLFNKGGFNSGEVGFRDESSGNETRVVFEVLRSKKKLTILNKLVEQLEEELTSTISFQIVIIDENMNVKTASVDELLLICFSKYSEAKRSMLEDSINKIQKKISETELIHKIRPLLKPYLSTNIPIDTIVSELSSKLKEPANLVSDILNKYSIKKLLQSNIDLDKLKSEETLFINKLNNIKDEIITDYDTLILN